MEAVATKANKIKLINMWKLALTLLLFASDTAYNFSLPSQSGSINLSDYQGKYILLVNTASNSPYAGQYGELEQLYQEFKDSLVVIAVPSNGFNNEPNDDSTIQSNVVTAYNIHYPLSDKILVNGDSAHALFKWLTSVNENHILGDTLIGDFQKYLIDKNGNLKGVFAPSVSPVSQEMRNNFLPLEQRIYLKEEEPQQ